MTVSVRSYVRETDYDLVGKFLVRTYEQEGGFLNWFQPTWEYMHFHSLLDVNGLHKIGVWEDNGKIVAVAHHEHMMGEVFLQIDSGWLHLKEDMIAYSEETLFREEDGKRTVSFYLDETDEEMHQILKERGYRPSSRFRRDMTYLDISKPFPVIEVAEGFQITDLERDDDIEKVHQVLHRGFNHPGEPPPDEIWARRLMQSAPGFRKALNIVVKAPDGNFAAYCGMWYEPMNHFAYVEPVATDPDYRRLGLGRAAVLEGIRRCGELGATVAYVGSGQDFYKSFGFDYSQRAVMWWKQLA